MPDATPCRLPECTAPSRTIGLCGRHYSRLQRHGTTDLVVPTEAERFWSKVKKTETCWLWTVGKSRQGYGSFKRSNGHTIPAHRFSLALCTDIAGLDVDHKCHTPACVNPDHLQAVTHKLNGENWSRASVRSRTGVRGVSWDDARECYRVQVSHDGKNYFGGRFSSLAEAESAAVQLRLKLHTNNLQDRGWSVSGSTS